MKNSLLLITSLVLLSCTASRTALQRTYNEQALITADREMIDYRVGDQWFRNQWSIAPEIANDTLQVVCYDPQTDFLFKTDQDSIHLQLKPGSIHRFYVLLGDSAYAHTIVQAVPFATQQLQFDDDRRPELSFMHQGSESAYLQQLRDQYPIALSAPMGSDQQKVLEILNWTNSRWQHNGNNSPKKNDAISILQEAEAGGQFPCFAYAIVLKDQLNAMGYKARTIYLKTRDAATSTYPPGHVATEVYLEDLQKWAFLDGQFNVMPILNGVPLNAVEFQDAITNRYDQFELATLGHPMAKSYYIDFVYPYLYYFDTSLDNRYNVTAPHLIDGKRSLMLVPQGAENLMHINFWNMEVDYCVYTHSLTDFYAKPE